MTSNTTDTINSHNSNTISERLFKLKQKNTQAAYLSFTLSDIYYAINIQNIVGIIEDHQLVYLSHISPPIVGMHYYKDNFIPVMDFYGYRPSSKNTKLLILSNNYLRNDIVFGLIVDQVNKLEYLNENNLDKNPYPFNNLLPSYYTASKSKTNKKSTIFVLDINDLSKQLD